MEFYFYMGAYISQETNEIHYMSCVCERNEGEFLETQDKKRSKFERQKSSEAYGEKGELIKSRSVKR
jgi:hypothetical protein